MRTLIWGAVIADNERQRFLNRISREIPRSSPFLFFISLCPPFFHIWHFYVINMLRLFHYRIKGRIRKLNKFPVEDASMFVACKGRSTSDSTLLRFYSPLSSVIRNPYDLKNISTIGRYAPGLLCIEKAEYPSRWSYILKVRHIYGYSLSLVSVKVSSFNSKKVLRIPVSYIQMPSLHKKIQRNHWLWAFLSLVCLFSSYL